MICSSKELPSVPDEHRVITPHLSDYNLEQLLGLYVDAGNPRSIHLLTRLSNVDKNGYNM